MTRQTDDVNKRRSHPTPPSGEELQILVKKKKKESSDYSISIIIEPKKKSSIPDNSGPKFSILRLKIRRIPNSKKPNLSLEVDTINTVPFNSK